MSKCIKNENGVYVELPREKIKFESKEAELIFDLSLENDELQQENKILREQLKIKHDGFMASTEELCEYATILEELKKWSEELGLWTVLDKIKELEEGKKWKNI